MNLALVPAAGSGSRFGGVVPKQYVEVSGKTVLERTVSVLASHPKIDAVLVVVAPNDALVERLADRLPEKAVVARVGGDTRAQTVKNGLDFWQNTQGFSDEDWVLVHDAARCCLKHDLIDRMFTELAADAVGGVPVLPMTDTVHQAPTDRLEKNLPRENIYRAQTPQMFRAIVLSRALASEGALDVTDEATAVLRLGLSPKRVAGDADNIKITHREDLAVAFRQPAWRIGQGYDVHRLVAGRPLILGGVNIPHHSGLQGHSDADALLHALTDALLGAAGLGDIGTLFPDTDPKFKNADSRVFLRIALDRVRAAGWLPENADCTVIAQQPKLKPHMPAIRACIAQDLGLPESAVNVKGKTNEGLGYLGHEEAIEAQAAVLLRRVMEEA